MQLFPIDDLLINLDLVLAFRRDEDGGVTMFLPPAVGLPGNVRVGPDRGDFLFNLRLALRQRMTEDMGGAETRDAAALWRPRQPAAPVTSPPRPGRDSPP